MSSQREDYLKAIYEDVLSKGASSNKSLASSLGNAPASVTGMIQRLQEEGLVLREKTKILLSDEGLVRAQGLLRRHRLWEVFLVDILGYEAHEAHSIAEELEHVSDAQLLERLDAFLQYPKVCPHGLPIEEESL